MEDRFIDLKEVLEITPKNRHKAVIDLWNNSKEDKFPYEETKDEVELFEDYAFVISFLFKSDKFSSDKSYRQLWIQRLQMGMYYQEHGIVDNLDKDEEQFIVFWIKPERNNSASLQHLAWMMEYWIAKHPGVKRILGIEQMLQGKPPVSAATLFLIPIIIGCSTDNLTERVGLVTVKRGLTESELKEISADFVENFDNSANITSCDQYCNMNR
jgi:hypothetical protein